MSGNTNKVNVDDRVSIITFSVPTAAHLNAYQKRLRVLHKAVVDKAGDKTFNVDGHRFNQGTLGTVVKVGHADTSRRVVVPEGGNFNAAIDTAKQYIHESTVRLVASLEKQLAAAKRLESTLLKDIEVKELDWD
ncbi:MAG: hypothetical protein GY833_23180 [Aestuariibacter sp.]|nr:hypothetical protein [Aestuariibacter sp.]